MDNTDDIKLDISFEVKFEDGLDADLCNDLLEWSYEGAANFTSISRIEFFNINTMERNFYIIPK